MLRIAVAALATIAAVGGAVVLADQTAGAATATGRSAPAAVAPAAGPSCGSGYRLIDVYRKANDSSDRVELEADLYYSSTAKRNCLIVMHVGSVYGVKAESLAEIWPSGSSRPKCNSTGCDHGQYSYFAGPVWTPKGVDMSHKCVDIRGLTRFDTHLERDRVHCG